MLHPHEVLELIMKGTKVEYKDEDEENFWWTFYKDQPARLIWEREFRIADKGDK